MLVVRPFGRTLPAYLWRCAKSARYVPTVARMFLMRLHQQTILGWWWLVIRAVLPSLGMIAILQHVPSLKPASIPYGLFVVSGMVPWTIIATGLLRGTRAIKQSRMIQARLALPKFVLVVASGGITGFFASVFAVLLFGIIAYYYIVSGELFLRIDWPILLAPLPLITCFMLYIGISSFTSLLFLFARDARLVLGVVTQFWFYFTPIIYSLDIMPHRWQLALLYLNPMTSLVEFFRWCLFGVGTWTATSLICSFAASVLLFLFGAWFLMRTEWVVREVAV